MSMLMQNWRWLAIHLGTGMLASTMEGRRGVPIQEVKVAI